MDHHKGVSVWADVEGFDNEYTFGRRPTGIYIPRYRNLNGDRRDYLRGFGFQGGAYREGWGRGQGDAIGAELKEALSSPGSWKLSFNGFGECLPYADNRAVLNTSLKDNWGRNSLTMEVTFRGNEQRMQADMESSLAEMLETCGYKGVKTSRVMSFPGNANHEMGAARMGRDPRTSVLNGFNQMHEVPNVFITDGSCMTSSACVNPSLTYMALTARACDYAVKELNKLSL
ncbi:MAG: GMC family oxidoreductase [Bacteroidota bacterium]